RGSGCRWLSPGAVSASIRGISSMAEAGASVAPADARPAPLVRPVLSRDDWIMRGGMVVIGLYLVLTLALPLWVMLAKSVESPRGEWVGLANYARYFATPALFQSIYNSLLVSIVSTVITV